MIPEASDRTAGPDLYMTVLKVLDWAACRDWYVSVLGLSPVLVDPAHGFVLLSAGRGRLAIQGGRQPVVGNPRPPVRLAFLVADVDAERHRLIGHGIPVEPPIANEAERYREIRLEDPEGTPVTLFSWTDNQRSGSSSEN